MPDDGLCSHLHTNVLQVEGTSQTSQTPPAEPNIREQSEQMPDDQSNTAEELRQVKLSHVVCDVFIFLLHIASYVIWFSILTFFLLSLLVSSLT